MFTVLMISTGIMLLAWVVFCVIRFIRNCRRSAASGDYTAHVRCERCGTEYDVSPEEFVRVLYAKTKSINKTEMKGPSLFERTRYISYSKKFMCPCCGKKRYAEVLNIEDIRRVTAAPSFRAGIKWLAAAAAGAMLIILVMSIPLHFAEEARKDRA